jgi:hypothetical protein
MLAPDFLFEWAVLNLVGLSPSGEAPPTFFNPTYSPKPKEAS